MRYWYNGDIDFSRALTLKEQESIISSIHFWGNPWSSNLYFSKTGDCLCFDNLQEGDIFDDLIAIKDLLAGFGITILEGSEITYYGDEDGAFVFLDNTWEYMPLADYHIYAASDHDLISELKRRGFDLKEDTL